MKAPNGVRPAKHICRERRGRVEGVPLDACRRHRKFHREKALIRRRENKSGWYKSGRRIRDKEITSNMQQS